MFDAGGSGYRESGNKGVASRDEDDPRDDYFKAAEIHLICYRPDIGRFIREGTGWKSIYAITQTAIFRGS